MLIAVSGCFIPPFAKTPKASAMSIGLTSPPPKVIESPYLAGSVKVVIPRSVAKLIKLVVPLSAKTRTAGILKEFPSANRAATPPWNLPS